MKSISRLSVVNGMDQNITTIAASVDSHQTVALPESWQILGVFHLPWPLYVSWCRVLFATPGIRATTCGFPDHSGIAPSTGAQWASVVMSISLADSTVNYVDPTSQQIYVSSYASESVQLQRHRQLNVVLRRCHCI